MYIIYLFILYRLEYYIPFLNECCMFTHIDLTRILYIYSYYLDTNIMCTIFMFTQYENMKKKKS